MYTCPVNDYVHYETKLKMILDLPRMIKCKIVGFFKKKFIRKNEELAKEIYVLKKDVVFKKGDAFFRVNRDTKKYKNGKIGKSIVLTDNTVGEFICEFDPEESKNLFEIKK